MRGKVPTDTRSTSFATDTERIRFARRYFRFFSDVVATEFHIVCDAQNCDMRAAFLVAPEDVPEWLEDIGAQSVPDADLSWAHDILPNSDRWRRNSAARVVARPDSSAVIAAYIPEGIVLKRVREL
jgi:hypothetical protein